MRPAGWGIFASVACVIHCAATPLLPGLGHGAAAALHAPWLESGLITLSLLLVGGSLLFRFRDHRRPGPLALFAAACAVLIVLRSLLDHGAPEQTGAAFLGAGLLVFAQLADRRIRACSCGHFHEEGSLERLPEAEPAD